MRAEGKEDNEESWGRHQEGLQGERETKKIMCIMSSHN